MFDINIPAMELWDEANEEFILKQGHTLKIEHSLVSVSKWEAKWRKPFLDKQKKTYEETVDYIVCMTITQNVKPEVYDSLTHKNIRDVNKYIDSPQHATWFAPDKKGKKSSESVTAELIYYWMIALSIPFECQKWHLNKLLALVRVCEIKSETPKKMDKKQTLSRNIALNEARRKAMNSKG